MKKFIVLLLVLGSFLTQAQLPYLNASTGNLDEFPTDRDTNMYGFYNNTLFKADKNLNVIWAKTYTIINFSGLLLSKTGSMFFFGDKFFGKMDLDGNILWAKSIDGIDAITSGTNSAAHTVICNRLLLDRNDNLVASGSTQINSSESGNGFICKTDTNGALVKLKMINDISTSCASPSYGFQVINDSAGIYKVIRFGIRGSMCSSPQNVVCLNYNDNNDGLSNYISLAFNSTEGYSMRWKIKKSKRNSDFYLHIDYRPGSMAQPLDITVTKYNLSAENLWYTRLSNLDGHPLTIGLNATENYKGQVLCQLANINTLQKIAVALIDTNGVTNGNCLVTYTCTGSAACWGATRLQSLINNSFLSETITNNVPFNPFNNMKINSALTSTCALTKTCSYTTTTGFSSWSINSFCGISTINSYAINSFLPTFTTLSLSINTTSCTMNDVGINENFLNSEKVNLYPNPASNTLQFKLTNTSFVEEATIIDLKGRNLKTHFNCSEIPVSNLSPGIYFLKLKSEGRLYYARFIKE